ncbi:MAG: FRG domain-containing protein [Deltaproteobacteria bacterium]|nr:FRG domain-containing protein [Deltaproteobacteria bacterium]
MAHKVGKRVRDLFDFLRIVFENRQSASTVTTLFRGVPNASYDLIPRIGRYKAFTQQLETRLMHEFKKSSIAYIQRDPETELEWLSLAQHHGLPTRLLDWTESPLVALWFSVWEGIQKAADGKPADGCVWILFNVDPEDSAYSANPRTDPYALDRIVFFRPPSIGPRIVSQFGWFSVHPYSDEQHSFVSFNKSIALVLTQRTRPINRSKEELLRLSELTGYPQELLKYLEVKIENLASNYKELPLKILIPSGQFENIRILLDELGINQQTLFPDLDGLTDHLKWKFLDRHLR